jgi:hypothetical protein
MIEKFVKFFSRFEKEEFEIFIFELFVKFLLFKFANKFEAFIITPIVIFLGIFAD